MKNNEGDGLDKVSESQRPFSKINFWMMGGCLALIVVGPLLAFLGFLLMAFSIIWKPKK